MFQRVSHFFSKYITPVIVPNATSVDTEVHTIKTGRSCVNTWIFAEVSKLYQLAPLLITEPRI